MVKEILKQCFVRDMVVYLPKQELDRKLYTDVAKQLNLIGGIWKGGKVSGFVFKEDPTELLAQIANGEKRNLKKEFQFFGTPEQLADELVLLADPDECDDILEPSAGQGAIVKAINKYCDPLEVFCFELMKINQNFLEQIHSVNLLGEDFLKCDTSQQYDKIIANPPFSKKQDIDHIYKMYEVLRNGGRMVSMCSPHFMHSTNKKETEFKTWLQSVNAELRELPEGTFSESGTKIKTFIIVINK